MEKETYRTFGGLMEWNKKEKIGDSKHSLLFPHYLCWILKMNGVGGKKQNKKQSQKLLKKKTTQKFWEVSLKHQRLVFKNCWDNDPGDHTYYSVGSVQDCTLGGADFRGWLSLSKTTAQPQIILWLDKGDQLWLFLPSRKKGKFSPEENNVFWNLYNF